MLAPLRMHARRLHATAAARMAEEAVAASSMTLNLAGPTRPMVVNEPVELVNIPGMAGEYGVAAEHAPVIAELKPGLVQVYKTEGADPENYFVSGGIASTHPDSSTDISAAEIAPLDELDVAKALAGYAEAKRTLEAAPEGSREAAVAQIECDVFEGVAVALGSSV